MVKSAILYSCIVSTLFYCHLAEGQILSAKGRFSIAFDRGCAPLTVQVTELHTPSGENESIVYRYYEGDTDTGALSYTYREPGLYMISQLLNSSPDSLYVEVLASEEPNVQISKCGNRQLHITSQDHYYDSVRVRIDDDVYRLANDETVVYELPAGEPSIVELKGLFNNADEMCDEYYYEVNASEELATPTVLSCEIKDVHCEGNYNLTLQLSEVDPFVNYRIAFEQESTAHIYDGYLTTTSPSFVDFEFTTGAYCVYLEAYDPCNNEYTTGSTFCSTINDLSLSPFESAYSTYKEGGIFISMDSLRSGHYNIYRKNPDEAYQLRGSSQNSYFDSHHTASRHYFHKIDYVDSCGQLAYSIETNPPLISAQLEAPNTYIISLIPPVNTLTTGFNSSAVAGELPTAQVTPIDETETLVQLLAANGTPRQALSAISEYSEGITLSSNTLIVKHEMIIYVPKAFTPNGDGLNDTLDFFGVPGESATILIYNRWGQQVFASDQYNPGWDGTINGQLADEGTYLYEIIFQNIDGETQRQKGSFALLNN